MIIWFAMLIPIIAAVALLVFFKHKVLWWEYLLPTVSCLVLIGVSSLASECSQTADTEYWGGLVKKAEYYEDWNEQVPCSHPEYCETCSTDSNGNTTCTEYVCGTQHLYDVDYHSEYWKVRDTNGISIRISEGRYRKLVRQFGNQKFVDLHRDYHTDDGDKYVTMWPGNRETAEPTTTKHTYENRVQASRSVFNYPEVTDQQIKQYDLYRYPKVRGSYYMKPILGNAGPKTSEASKGLAYYNGLLGPRRQVRAFILVFHNQPIDAGHFQEALWVGGNKNEFVLAVGLNGQEVEWAHVFSWSKKERLKLDAEVFVSEQKEFDPVATVDWLGKNLKRFDRREFAEFEYLHVEPPTWLIVLTYVLTLIITIGTSVFAVVNKFDDKNPNGSRRFRRW